MSFEEESPLVWPDVTFCLYPSFHFVNGVAGLDVQGDRASYHSLDEDLHAGSRPFPGSRRHGEVAGARHYAK